MKIIITEPHFVNAAVLHEGENIGVVFAFCSDLKFANVVLVLQKRKKILGEKYSKYLSRSSNKMIHPCVERKNSLFTDPVEIFSICSTKNG